MTFDPIWPTNIPKAQDQRQGHHEIPHLTSNYFGISSVSPKSLVSDTSGVSGQLVVMQFSGKIDRRLLMVTFYQILEVCFLRFIL